MNNYDDLFNSNDNKFKENNKNAPFDKDAWVEKKRQERAEAYALLDTATEEIVKDAEKFRDFLNTQAQFDRYSVSNALLIAYQHPGATKVADFAAWKEEDISITGHRKIPSNEISMVSEKMRKTVVDCIENGYCYFGAGGALGFDTLAAQTVLELKKDYPQIRLILVLPCNNQTRGWSETDIYEYERIKAKADKVVYRATAQDR